MYYRTVALLLCLSIIGNVFWIFCDKNSVAFCRVISPSLAVVVVMWPSAILNILKDNFAPLFNVQLSPISLFFLLWLAVITWRKKLSLLWMSDRCWCVRTHMLCWPGMSGGCAQRLIHPSSPQKSGYHVRSQTLIQLLVFSSKTRTQTFLYIVDSGDDSLSCACCRLDWSLLIQSFIEICPQKTKHESTSDK